MDLSIIMASVSNTGKLTALYLIILYILHVDSFRLQEMFIVEFVIRSVDNLKLPRHRSGVTLPTGLKMATAETTILTVSCLQ